MTENKRFTRTEIIKIICGAGRDYYNIYGREMSLSERLFFTDIHETIKHLVDRQLEEIENGDVE